MHTARTFGLLAGVVALIVATPSAAQDGDLTTTPESGDTFTVGVGVGYAPSYQGSDDYKVVPVPALRGRVSGFNFNTRGASLNVDFVREEQGATLDIQLGAIAGVRLERTGGIKDEQVKALGKLDEAVELGGFVGIAKTGVITSDFDTLSFRVSYVRDVADAHDSYVIQPALEYGTPLGPGTYIGMSASGEIVGKAFAGYYSNVSPAGAVASGLSPFQSEEGGLKDVSFTVLGAQSLSRDLRQGWSVVVVARYSRLLGDFKRSPIVSVAGDADQWMGGLGLAYTF